MAYEYWVYQGSIRVQKRVYQRSIYKGSINDQGLWYNGDTNVEEPKK